MTTGLNKVLYQDLITDFLPRPIKTEDDYDAIQDEIDRLVDKGDLSDAEEDYLDVLGTLVWSYEERTEKDDEYELRGVELIRGLLDLHGLKQKDLTSIFKTESITSAVLNKKRPLTAQHIGRLALYFNVSHELFFEPILTSTNA